jgi:hypothetical protein
MRNLPPVVDKPVAYEEAVKRCYSPTDDPQSVLLLLVQVHPLEKK